MSEKISVIMGIYNCANTLGEALDCIINQTYTNWEVIMCDDYSSDDTVQIAEKYVQKYPGKFLLLKNKENHGLNYTLNKCLKVANGDYIARMDGDDLCAVDRFEKEVKVLDEHEDISIVSTDMNFFFPSISQSIKPKRILTTKNCLLPFNSHVKVVVAINKYAVNGKSTEYLYKVLNRHTQLIDAKKNNHT